MIKFDSVESVGEVNIPYLTLEQELQESITNLKKRAATYREEGKPDWAANVEKRIAKKQKALDRRLARKARFAETAPGKMVDAMAQRLSDDLDDLVMNGKKS